MIKKYFFLLLLPLMVLFTQQTLAQNVTGGDNQPIEGLSIYPNPVSKDKSSVVITSKSGLQKTVTIYNVLGKQISASIFVRRELDISLLKTGVYILRITENKVSETRKLIVQ